MALSELLSTPFNVKVNHPKFLSQQYRLHCDRVIFFKRHRSQDLIIHFFKPYLLKA